VGVRGPLDAVNLGVIWGLKESVAREAVGEAGRSVVAGALLKTRSYRGVIDVISGGIKSKELPSPTVTKAAPEEEKTEVMDVDKNPVPESQPSKKRKTVPTETPQSKHMDKKQKTASGTRDTELKPKARNTAEVQVAKAEYAQRMAVIETAVRAGKDIPEEVKLKTTPGRAPKRAKKGKK
jgi:hypothetical protein